MAQSALTVTTSSPTPPTNMSFTGATVPNPPNYSKTHYANPFNIGATGKPSETVPGVGVNPNPPPYFDDGTAGALSAFATNTAALAGGSGATAGGTGMPTAATGGSYPWPLTGSAPQGDTPASASLAHEGGTIVLTTYPGNRQYAYVGGVTLDMSIAATIAPPNYSNIGPVSGTGASINSSHASTLSPATTPALASISPTTAVSGASGTDTVTFTGTDFTRQSTVWVQHGTLPPVQVATTYASATSLTAPVPKRTAAGASVVYVVTGGVVTTVTKTITYS